MLDRVKLQAAFLSLMLICSCKSSRTNVFPFEEISQQTGLDFWQFSGATGELLLP